MLSLQQKTYAAVVNQPQYAKIKSVVDKAGGVDGLGKNMEQASAIAKELQIDVKEIEEEVIMERTMVIVNERTANNPAMQKRETELKKVMRNRGFRLFWMSCFTDKDEVSERGAPTNPSEIIKCVSF